MAATNSRASRKSISRDFIESRSPATGEVLGSSPIATEEQVAAAVSRSRGAFERWGELTSSRRQSELTAFRRGLAVRAEEVADLVSKETGKPLVDATSEVLMGLMHLTHAIERGPTALAPRRVSSIYLPNFRADVSYEPLGIVAVIGPWNYPFYTPMGSIAYALAAGNSVVFKPSELTPLVGQLLAEIAEEHLSVDNLLQVVTGEGTTGAALARSAVDKIAFTGSVSTGRLIMAAASERLTPVLMELGGNDAMLVMEDADLDAAANAAVFGSMHNSGQACVSIERCLVVESAYRPFLEKVKKNVAELRWGGDQNDDIGPLTNPSQVDVIRRHLMDAQTKGANILMGGIEGIRDNFVPPTIVVDVDSDMLLMKEETFGPVLPIMRVQNEEAAIKMANSGEFGLASAVFSASRGTEIANRLRAGATSVNSVLPFGALPSLPFGGIGDSGFGRIHGDEGLREFSRTKSTATKRFDTPFDMMAFGVPVGRVRRLVEQLFAGGPVDKASSVVRRLVTRG